MMSKMFHGTGVALATPFTNEGKVDFHGLEKLLIHVSDGGVDYLVVHGTTSEAPTLTEKEREETLSFIKSNNPKKLPLVVGMGGNNTAALVDRIRSFDFEGLQGILSVAPYYNRPNQAGLLAHFIAVADASPLPIILYNVPPRTGCNLEADTTLELAAHDKIIGVKEASGDLDQCAKINEFNSDMLLISGDDGLTLPILHRGGVGVISVIANALPEPFTSMVNHFLEGSVDSAEKIAGSMEPMIDLAFQEGSPTGLKEMLSQLGICTNAVRLPLVSASEQLSVSIASKLKNWA